MPLNNIHRTVNLYIMQFYVKGGSKGLGSKFSENTNYRDAMF